MSLDKAIAHGKEHRSAYYGAKAVDPTCRNHGSDDWATSDRLHKYRKAAQAAADNLHDYQEEHKCTNFTEDLND